jgi:hypothetical protein
MWCEYLWRNRSFEAYYYGFILKISAFTTAINDLEIIFNFSGRRLGRHISKETFFLAYFEDPVHYE